MTRSAWLGLLALMCGCESGGSAPAPDAAASTTASAAAAKPTASASAKPPPVPKGVKLTLDGKEYTFEHAWVYSANGPVVRLSTHPYNCSGDLDKAAMTLDFTLRPGPGGNHFATGKPVAVSISIYPPEGGQKLPEESWENGAQVTLEPFEFKEGGTVKGTLAIDYEGESDGKKYSYKGGGGFEGKICEASDLGRFPAQATAPDAPVTGDIDGKPFTVQTALVSAADMDGYKWVANIFLFDGPAACEDANDSTKKRHLRVRPRGANSREKLTGGPQVADAAATRADGSSFSSPWFMESWVQLDTLSFEPDSTIKGRLAITGQQVAQDSNYMPITVAGTFEAKVCP